MKARLIALAVVASTSALGGCASLAEGIVDGLVEAAVEGAFAVALSPFDDDKPRHKATPAAPLSYASMPTSAPVRTREKGVQQ